MKPNLVIVESPAKAPTIEKFLGEDYKVVSCYGHIRDLKKRDMSVDEKSFEPQYEIPADKQKVVGELKKLAKEAQTVWLATDEDREGEAISWHLYEVLGLKGKDVRRIVFHEITKQALQAAIEHPRDINLHLVNAQQARRVLDRIVGFKISPVLWKKVRPRLSAGRVQSVAVRLVVEREREIQQFQGKSSYRVTATFLLPDGNTMKAELSQKFQTEEEAQHFLEQCKNLTFCIDDLQTRPAKRTPAPPFTTSTLQQEAAHKLGFTLAQTMNVAQRLYESGRITYMRTDSVNLSTLCLGTSKKYIGETMGEEYVKTRQFHTSSKGAQEAHEAIRPTYMDQTEIEGTAQERKLYNLIWKRTIACQMADAELERTTATIQVQGTPYAFVATGEVVKFDGFLRVYRETETDENADRPAGELPPMAVGMALERSEIQATQRFPQRPARYNEASLVKKLDELEIGRPSTQATAITTIQQREYVEKADKPGETVSYKLFTLKGDQIKEEKKTQIAGSERGKLVPTDTGIVVNDFLFEHFPQELDYSFTAEVEKQFDEIAKGQMEWHKMIADYYKDFVPRCDEAMQNNKSEHRVGERILGNDPATGLEVSVKISRYGVMAQIGRKADGVTPRYAQLKASQSIESITLEEALELFRLPRTLGLFEGSEVTVGAGRFGPYVHHKDAYASIPKGIDPLEISLTQGIELLKAKREGEAKKHIKTFKEEPELEVLNGRFGPYLAYKGKNYKVPKTLHANIADITLEQCMKLIEDIEANPKPAAPRRRTARKG